MGRGVGELARVGRGEGRGHEVEKNNRDEVERPNWGHGVEEAKPGKELLT